jgi:hypothetical protein
MCPFQYKILFSDRLLQRLHLSARLKLIIIESKVNKVFESARLFPEGVVKWTEIWTMVFLRMKNGGKKEVFGGSLIVIHNNYKITRK